MSVQQKQCALFGCCSENNLERNLKLKLYVDIGGNKYEIYFVVYNTVILCLNTGTMLVKTEEACNNSNIKYNY